VTAARVVYARWYEGGNDVTLPKLLKRRNIATSIFFILSVCLFIACLYSAVLSILYLIVVFFSITPSLSTT